MNYEEMIIDAFCRVRYSYIVMESESYLAVSMVTGERHEKSYFLATLQNFRYFGHKSNPKLGNFKQHDDIL